MEKITATHKRTFTYTHIHTRTYVHIQTLGSPEYLVHSAIPADGITVADLNKAVGDSLGKIGLGQCMKNKWAKKDGDKIVRLQNDVKDETAELLRCVRSNNLGSVHEKALQDLKKRKLLQQVIRKSYKIEKGPEFKPQRVKKMADLTSEMLGNKEDMGANAHWSDLEFKKVNLNAMGAAPLGK